MRRYLMKGILVSLFILLVACESNSVKHLKTIGVIQYTDHTALNASYAGFMAALEDNGYIDGETIQIDYKNAQGELPTTQTIANQFVNDKVDMIFAIATPAAQAAYNATKDIPIIITAVTDPVSAGIVNDWDLSGTNVTGTSNLSPTDEQINLIQELVPDAKTIGLLYTTSEVNSEVQVEKAEEVAQTLGMKTIRMGISSATEIQSVLQSMMNQIDALYIPTDNLLASSMPIVWSSCVEKQIPVIPGVDTMVIDGGVATRGLDLYELGYETGLMAIDVLEGADPSSMPIKTLEQTTLIINQKNANDINLVIPEKLLNEADIVVTK